MSGRDPRLVEPDRASAPRAADRAPAEGTEAPHDPLRLCVFATVALLTWLLGPVAVLVFAGIGFAGYWRARRAGLLRSRCRLGDTRLVLVYLGGLVVLAAFGIWRGWWTWG